MHHLIPQAPCLVTSSGEWAADYVVRTERLQDDMREVRQLGTCQGIACITLPICGCLMPAGTFSAVPSLHGMHLCLTCHVLAMSAEVSHS